MTRLQRALANPQASAPQIRAIAAELPTVGLEDALAILLALVEGAAGRAAGVGGVGGGCRAPAPAPAPRR